MKTSRASLVSPVSFRSAAGRVRRGFTLLELLVVIGIIGLLAAVTISQFGGVTESAKATQCQTNLRNLAVAVQNIAARDEHGSFPGAGSFKYLKTANRKLEYPEWKGWISWGHAPDQTSKGGGSVVPFSSSDDELLRYAVTNGAIWSAMGGARSSYVCPVHAALCSKRNARQPGWSYVMNQAFGFDSNYGSGPVMNMGTKSLSDIVNGDRLLLFAEIQGRDDADRGLVANTDGSGTGGDSVLQYFQNEVIGFNHETSRGLAGHVAFADGHVETLRYPTGGLSLTELTKALCEGHELRFNGKGFEDLSQ